MSSETHASGIGNKIMLVGIDNNHVLEKRLQAAGCQVIKVTDEKAVLDHVRHGIFDKAVMVSTGSLIDTAEMIFSQRVSTARWRLSFWSTDPASIRIDYSANYCCIRLQVRKL